MQLTSQSGTLIQLTRWNFVNCQLVREDDGFTLIDTGLSGCAKGIIAAAKRMGGTIQRIVLTHAHIDHVGSLDALHQLLPDAEVIISTRDARFIQGDHSLDPNEPKEKLRGGYPVCKTKPTRLLNNGDRVGSLEVITTPGHTPGHLSLFDPRTGALIVGDAFFNRGGLSTAGTLKLVFPVTALGTWHRPAGLHSAEILLARRPSVLAMGHGKVLINPIPAMEQAIAEANHLLRIGTL